MECFDDSVYFLLANQGLLFQADLPNKKARRNVHRAVFTSSRCFSGESQNNSQISCFQWKRREYNTILEKTIEQHG